jgi:hypothetical protein
MSPSTSALRAREFLARLDRDPVLQDRLQAYSIRTGFDLLRDLTRVATEIGYDFTVDDLRRALDLERTARDHAAEVRGARRAADSELRSGRSLTSRSLAAVAPTPCGASRCRSGGLYTASTIPRTPPSSSVSTA